MGFIIYLAYLFLFSSHIEMPRKVKDTIMGERASNVMTSL